jgi:hypothetical protein
MMQSRKIGAHIMTPIAIQPAVRRRTSPGTKILNVQVLIATHSDRDALHETTVRPLQMGEALEPRVAAGFVSRAHALSGSMR